MSWTASADESRENPAFIAAVLRRPKSTHALYWRYKRPRARVYAGALGKVVAYRLIAAIAAVFAITLLAFAGAVAGIIGNPRWPALKSIHGERISKATISAAADLGHWVPAFLLLGLILTIVPRPHRWLFRITMLAGGAVGYFQQRIPPFPHSAVANDITLRAASTIGRIPLPTSTASISVSIIPAAIAALIGYLLYQISYNFTLRTTDFIPSRPVKHYRSAFRAVSMTRRLIAALVAAALLAIDFWLAENIRLSLPHTHYDTFLLMNSHLSSMEWLIAVFVFALAICAPRPQGYQSLLIVFIIAITVYSFLPYQILPPMPVGVPAIPDSFWVLAVVYLLVTGLSFDLVGLLLDWPYLMRFSSGQPGARH